jgi:hypothetical protein
MGSDCLARLKDLREFKIYAVDRFRGIVYAAIKSSRKTNSPIPIWAEAKVIEALDVCSKGLLDSDIVRNPNQNVFPQQNTLVTPSNRTDIAVLRNNKPHAVVMGTAISKH